ncbi:MAG: site-2 protease family protein, partial [Oscillibacter sp.]
MHYLQELFQALDFASMGDAVLRVLAIFLCLTIHETCHGLAAYALGDPTAKELHRLSLNPLRHIDWFGLLM